jgi:hypothetical protein
LAIKWDGTRTYGESGNSSLDTNVFSSDGSTLISGFKSTNAALWGTSVSMPSLSTNSIPYIGGGGIISTVALSGKRWEQFVQLLATGIDQFPVAAQQEIFMGKMGAKRNG